MASSCPTISNYGPLKWLSCIKLRVSHVMLLRGRWDGGVVTDWHIEFTWSPCGSASCKYPGGTWQSDVSIDAQLPQDNGTSQVPNMKRDNTPSLDAQEKKWSMKNPLQVMYGNISSTQTLQIQTQKQWEPVIQQGVRCHREWPSLIPVYLCWLSSAVRQYTHFNYMR